MSSYYPTTSTVDQTGGTAISAVHSDIIQTNILTRLDGPTLASAGCASPQLHALCTEEKLWTDICNSTWPSTNTPTVRDVISTFPSGHRSFFSDSFPTLDHHDHHRRLNPNHCRQIPTTELVSAVDLHYKSKLVFSKVEVSETVTEWFRCSPFRIDLLDQKETLPTPVKFEGDEDTCRSHLERHMTLSWVVIDPTTKRAANLSSLNPVSVHRHWLTGDFQLRYSTIMASGPTEFIQCSIVVTCGGKEGGELHVMEVFFQMQDMDGKNLYGKDSLVILQEAMEKGKRKKRKRGEERERYEEFLEMKKERIMRKERRERRLDMLCIVTGVTIFMAFLGFVLLR